jgi:hypothetical protein
MLAPRRTSAVPLVAVPLLVGAALTSCSTEVDEADAGPSTPSSAETTLETCRELLPDEALDALGWARRGEPRLDGSSCTQETAEGLVTVRRRPVGAGSAAELPAAAQQAFDARCAELGGMVGDPAGEEVDWMGPGTPACVAASEGDTGTTTLLVLWPGSGLLVETRVEADEPTGSDDVEAAVTVLADAAERVLQG